MSSAEAGNGSAEPEVTLDHLTNELQALRTLETELRTKLNELKNQ